MAEQTAISWCDSTYNPWIGCTRVSAACDHCYAETLSKRMGWADWGAREPRKRTATYKNVISWQRSAGEFYADHGRRRRVFCASLADVFDNAVPADWRADLWLLIRACPDLDFLMLTKRPQNIGKMKPEYWDEIRGHIWLGTTVEQNQHRRRIGHLQGHGVPVRFVSIEPMLEYVNLSAKNEYNLARRYLECVDWVIVGGESGPGHRPMSEIDVHRVRADCKRYNVPFHFKQWGGLTPDANGCRLAGREYKAFPDG